MTKTVTFNPVVCAMPAPRVTSVEQRWLDKNDFLRIKEDNIRAQQHRETDEGCCQRGLQTCFESYKQRYLRKTAVKVVLFEQERGWVCTRKLENEEAISAAYRKVSKDSGIEALQRGMMDAYEAKNSTPVQLHRPSASVSEKTPRLTKVPRRSDYTPRRSHFVTGGRAA